MKLEFSQEALSAIAEQAQEKKTGARGLKAILVRAVLIGSYIGSQPPCIMYSVL